MGSSLANPIKSVARVSMVNELALSIGKASSNGIDRLLVRVEDVYSIIAVLISAEATTGIENA